jgi:cyclic pyranopterin phosphate synthase
MNQDESRFTHIDAVTNNPAMVDVSDKAVTKRTATARSIIVLGDAIMQHLNNSDIHTKKGPVFQTAIIAGTMAAKKTSDLIPFCHPIGLENCRLNIFINDVREVVIECTATITAKTGVEMEALTGATIAALTVYDMCKALSHDIIIRETRLISKTGVKSDYHASE